MSRSGSQGPRGRDAPLTADQCPLGRCHRPGTRRTRDAVALPVVKLVAGEGAGPSGQDMPLAGKGPPAEAGHSSQPCSAGEEISHAQGGDRPGGQATFLPSMVGAAIPFTKLRTLQAGVGAAVQRGASRTPCWSARPHSAPGPLLCLRQKAPSGPVTRTLAEGCWGEHYTMSAFSGRAVSTDPLASPWL